MADEAAQATAIERSIRPEAVSLAPFALVLTITALLVVGQAATRLLAVAQPANPVLAALGMTRGQLMAAGMLQVRLALDPGRGRAAAPVRSALTGAALTVLAVTAAFTFGASLLHLVHTPRLYGQTWDAAIDMQFGSLGPRQAERILAGTPGVTGWTYGNHGTIGIGGLVVPAIGVAAGRGPLLSPTLLAGRPPHTSREIVLGTSTLRRIGRTVGQTVTVTIGGHRQVDRIVGRAAGHWSWSLFAADLGIPRRVRGTAAPRSAHGARGDPRGQRRRVLAGQEGRAGEPGAGAAGGVTPATAAAANGGPGARHTADSPGSTLAGRHGSGQGWR